MTAGGRKNKYLEATPHLNDLLFQTLVNPQTSNTRPV